MKDIAKKHLDNVLLPFWKKLCDQKHGGFVGKVDFSLAEDHKAVKGCILNARILWFFSNAYLVGGDEESLKYATHAYRFLRDYAVDPMYGGVYWSLNYDGTSCDEMKHTYNQAFQIYALSAYYEATSDEEALQLAYKLFETIETKCKSHIGYNEGFTRDFQPTSNEKLSDNKEVVATGLIASKTMNTILHVLEAYTEFYKVTKDPEVKSCLVELLKLVEQKIYNSETRQLEVFFDDQYKSLVDMHSYGHDIEAAWLLDRACEVLGDEAYTEAFKEIDLEIINHVIEVAFDKELLYNERVGQHIDRTRVWWVQAETVVGLINAYEQTAQEDYLEKAEAVLNFIMRELVDHRPNSEWHWELDENNKDTARKPIVEEWKCPYHNGRMLFEIMKRGI